MRDSLHSHCELNLSKTVSQFLKYNLKMLGRYREDSKQSYGQVIIHISSEYGDNFCRAFHVEIRLAGTKPDTEQLVYVKKVEICSTNTGSANRLVNTMLNFRFIRCVPVRDDNSGHDGDCH